MPMLVLDYLNIKSCLNLPNQIFRTVDSVPSNLAINHIRRSKFKFIESPVYKLGGESKSEKLARLICIAF